MAKPADTIDKLGACASALCAVHCVLTGLFLGALPAVGVRFATDPRLETALIAFLILTGAWAVWRGYRRHRLLSPGVLFGAGLALVLASHFGLFAGVGTSRTSAGVQWVGAAMAVVGGSLVVWFYVWNRRLMVHASACCHGPESKSTSG